MNWGSPHAILPAAARRERDEGVRELPVHRFPGEATCQPSIVPSQGETDDTSTSHTDFRLIVPGS